jgi:chaperonin GroEL (HSP60 family)
MRLKEYARGFSGREQLAIMRFAEALEEIPLTLAENSGLDPVDIIVELRSAHTRGEKNAGINVFTGKVTDMLKEGIVEPAIVKKQAIKSATEAAIALLKIDDIIAAAAPKKEKEEKKGPESEGLGMAE